MLYAIHYIHIFEPNFTLFKIGCQSTIDERRRGSTHNLSDYLRTNTNEPDHKSTSSIPMSMSMEQETRVRLSFCIKFQ